jgi:sterol desaturase/sphingolipid hydroxylase (fatty acid hydroxylase superfamily)
VDLLDELLGAERRGYYSTKSFWCAADALIVVEIVICYLITELWVSGLIPRLGLASGVGCPAGDILSRRALVVVTPMGYTFMYFAICGGIEWLYTNVWPEHNLIQEGKKITEYEQKNAICFGIRNILSSAAVSGLFYKAMRGETNIRWGLPTLMDIPWLALVYVIVDMYQFWIHLFMHRPWFYSRWHKVHHMWKTPNAWCVSALHPAEHLLYTAPMLWISVCAPLTVGTWLAFLLLVYVFSAMDHSGIDMKDVLIHKVFFWQSPSGEFHDRHHEFFECNYGVMLDWWDKMAGTLWTPKKAYAEGAVGAAKCS